MKRGASKVLPSMRLNIPCSCSASLKAGTAGKVGGRRCEIEIHFDGSMLPARGQVASGLLAPGNSLAVTAGHLYAVCSHRLRSITSALTQSLNFKLDTQNYSQMFQLRRGRGALCGFSAAFLKSLAPFTAPLLRLHSRGLLSRCS